MSLQHQDKSRERRSGKSAIEFAKINGTDLKVSRVGLGTWAIGGWMWGGTEESTSIETIRAALALGLNVIDTAPVYGFGRSEEIVGKALADGLRDRAVIATKVGIEWHDGKTTRNSSRDRIMREVENSLRRLKTDRIDVYQVHWPDPKVPMAETAAAMRDLFEQGTIRAIGVSNFSVAQMDVFRKTAPIHVVQPPYNLFERAIDRDVLPYCKKQGTATFGYGALCRGLLSGRMRPDTKFKGDDLRLHDPKFRAPRFAQYLEAVKQLDQLAHERCSRSVLDLAVRWVLDQGITTALWGARRPDHLGPVGEVMGWHLDSSAKAEIEQILDDTITDPVGPEFMAPAEYA